LNQRNPGPYLAAQKTLAFNNEVGQYWYQTLVVRMGFLSILLASQLVTVMIPPPRRNAPRAI
jgi:hypothetical protein